MPLFVLAAVLPLAAAAPPSVAEKAPDFALSTPQGKSVWLSEMVSKGPVVLVVLRGYPGYQCPFCNRQVQDFIQKSQAFADVGAHVLLVYPGPPQDLNVKANEFLADKKVPDNFDLLLDPGSVGRRARNGLPVHVPHRSPGFCILQEDREGARRAHNRVGNPGRDAKAQRCGMNVRRSYDISIVRT